MGLDFQPKTARMHHMAIQFWKAGLKSVNIKWRACMQNFVWKMIYKV